MNVSKVTFSEEFKEKFNKKISPQEKGRLRWERLVELDKIGALQKITSRRQLASAVGIQSPATGAAWAGSMVKQGVIIETLTGYNNYKAVYEYHLGKPLKYTNGRKKANQPVKEVATVEQVKSSVANSVTKNETGNLELIVTVDGVNIQIKNATIECVVTLVKEFKK